VAARDDKAGLQHLRSSLMRIVVVGGGVSGLGSAVALARAGHDVTVVERDATAMPESADAAFDWDRRGAPQVRHSHAFLARLRNILIAEYPDILRDLLAEGATEIHFGDDLPPTITDFERLGGDDELTMIACRRTTFEWVLRRHALAEGAVTFRTGVGVRGLLTAGSAPVPVITGVALGDGSTIDADLTVVAAGRRSSLPEEVEDTGIVYYSRFYRLVDGATPPPRSGPIGGDLGYLKYGVFMGDNRTFSVTLATPTADDVLRKALSHTDAFDRCARSLVATAPWMDGRAEPLSDDVYVMAGLLNRWRDYVIDGTPLALGVLPVGDAVVCTNPLYGRGCSTGFWGAQLLAAAVASHGDDLHDLALSYDQALRDNLLPWYRSTVMQDSDARRVAGAMLVGEDPDADGTDPRTFMRSVLRDGLLPALQVDAVVLRAFVRTFNLLTAPDALLTDQAVFNRVLAVWQDRDNRPPMPALGPKHRVDLLELLAG
jgi:2-polyprenyl-6-methoxyphenol hydroxylase-like FAD-dependent oxidoreductase